MKTSTLGSSRQALIRRMNGTSCPQHSHELLAETESAKNHNRRRRPAWPSARPRRGHCTAVAVTCAQCIPLRAARRAEPRRSGPTSVGVSRARTAALRTLRVAYSLTITAVFWRQWVRSSPSGSQSALPRKPLVRRRQGAHAPSPPWPRAAPQSEARHVFNRQRGASESTHSPLPLRAAGSDGPDQ